MPEFSFGDRPRPTSEAAKRLVDGLHNQGGDNRSKKKRKQSYSPRDAFRFPPGFCRVCDTILDRTFDGFVCDFRLRLQVIDSDVQIDWKEVRICLQPLRFESIEYFPVIFAGTGQLFGLGTLPVGTSALL